MRTGWIPPHKRTAIACILALAVFSQACGASGFAHDLRLALSLSAPLIDSLVQAGVIKPEQRATYIQDFTDLANGAAVLGDDLKACADKVCKLNAVDRFQILFFDIERRGHFKVSPKLQNVETILKGIISAAKVYYAPATSRAVRTSDKDAEASIKAQIQTLRVAMKG